MTHTYRRSTTATMALAAIVLCMGVQAQTPSSSGSAQGATAPQSRSNPTTSPQSRSDATTAPQSRSNPATAPSAGRGLEGNGTRAAPTPPRGDALAPGTGAGNVTGGVPEIAGVTPNRAELPASAFGKLDTGKRGYVTLEDTRQLQGFETAFREGDQNGDGRLNMSEFNTAWGIYTGNVR